MSSDPVRDLNNFLQGHKKGNCSGQLSWAMTETGPQHQVTHHATAKFRGETIGRGDGVSKGLAKAAAATEALQYLRDHPLPS